MAISDTDATERAEPEPAAARDPSLSPAEGHVEHMHSPVPTVLHHHHEPAPAPIDQVDQAPRGVKLAKISQTGDRVFRALATTAGLAIVLLVLFVGIFLLALALPSLQADQDNFFTSRNWTVSGNELRFGIAGLLWTTVLSSILAMADRCPDRRWRGALSDPVPAQASLRAGLLRGRSSCRCTVDHLRPVGPDRSGAVLGSRGRVADQQDRLDTAVQ